MEPAPDSVIDVAEQGDAKASGLTKQMIWWSDVAAYGPRWPSSREQAVKASEFYKFLSDAFVSEFITGQTGRANPKTLAAYAEIQSMSAKEPLINRSNMAHWCH